MKKANILILTILGIAAAIGAVLLIRRTNAEAADTLPGGTGGSTSGGSTSGGGGTSGSGGSSTGGSSSGLNYNLVLKTGSGFISNGAEVKALQNILNRVEVSSPLVVDGMFGPLTEAKLKRNNGGFGQISLSAAKAKWPWA